MKKLYMLDLGDGALAAVAESKEKAVEYLWRAEGIKESFETKADVLKALEYRRKKVPQDMRVGVPDYEKGLRLGFYGYLIEWPCERCDRGTTVRLHKGKVLCDDCQELAVAEGK